MNQNQLSRFSISSFIKSKDYISYLVYTVLMSLNIPVNIFLTTRFIDIIMYDSSYKSIVKILIFILLINIFYSIIKNVNILKKKKYSQVIFKTISNQFLSLASSVSSNCYEKKEFSNLLNKIRNMYEEVFFGLVNSSIIIASVLPATIGLCIIIGKIQIKLLLVLITISALLSFLFYKAKKREINLWGEAMLYFRNFRYFSSVLTTKKFSQETRVYNSYGFISNLWEKNILNFQAKVRKGNNSARVSTGIIRIIEYALSVLILYMMIPLIVKNSLTIGAYIALASALWELANILDEGMMSVADGISRYRLFRQEESKLYEVIESSCSEKEDKKINLDSSFKFESLRVQHLSYRYPGESKYVLKDVSFEIQKGTLLGLVGLNGSGKSTLIKLLLKLIEPESGSICVNGIDISKISKKSYYKLISAVFQDVCKFELTLEDFLKLGDISSDKTFDEIMQVARKVVDDEEIIEKMINYRYKIIGHQMQDAVDLSRVSGICCQL